MLFISSNYIQIINLTELHIWFQRGIDFRKPVSNISIKCLFFCLVFRYPVSNYTFIYFYLIILYDIKSETIFHN